MHLIFITAGTPSWTNIEKAYQPHFLIGSDQPPLVDMGGNSRSWDPSARCVSSAGTWRSHRSLLPRVSATHLPMPPRFPSAGIGRQRGQVSRCCGRSPRNRNPVRISNFFIRSPFQVRALQRRQGKSDFQPSPTALLQDRHSGDLLSPSIPPQFLSLALHFPLQPEMKWPICQFKRLLNHLSLRRKT
jgi:hypothetical protein